MPPLLLQRRQLRAEQRCRPLPSPRYGYIVAVGVGKQGPGGEWMGRLWGPCPFQALSLNGEPQEPLQEDGGFLWTAWPLKNGRNRISLTLASDVAANPPQAKLFLQAGPS